MSKFNVNEETSDIFKGEFSFQNAKNGNLLTIHHTVTEENAVIRIRFTNASFSSNNLFFTCIDHRGNIFVFNLRSKKFRKIKNLAVKCSFLIHIPNIPSEVIIGTKAGEIIIFDIREDMVKKAIKLSEESIIGISFSNLVETVLIFTKREAILISLKTFKITHCLDFDENKISIKYISYFPRSDKIIAVFSNDSVQIWSGNTLRILNNIKPLRLRENFLKNNPNEELTIFSDTKSDLNKMFKEVTKDLSANLIDTCTISQDGNFICLTTIDDFIIILSSLTCDIIKLINLKDSACKKVSFLPDRSPLMLFILTLSYDVVLINCDNLRSKILIQDNRAHKIDISNDGKMLYVIMKTGEIEIYQTSIMINLLLTEQKYLENIKTKKKIDVDNFNLELKATISKKRLLPILKEFNSFPDKYRNIIWRIVLDLPYNKNKFFNLVQKGNHPRVNEFKSRYPLKNANDLRNLKRILSCLINWCPLFGHCEFIPEFIFPFIKVFNKSPILCFETIVTILCNYCQLWFEYAPLKPVNYLGLVENILNEFDSTLLDYYKRHDVTSEDYAWSLMGNAFSKVLDENQWYKLWDNILSNHPYFLVFSIVSYNIVQRNEIMKLESTESIRRYFNEQNIIDMKHFMDQTNELIEKCPDNLHPKHYIKDFKALPKGFYPKFENYPKVWINAKELEMQAFKKENEILNRKIQELENNEIILAKHLKTKLKKGEHDKRMSDVEKFYAEALHQEEERIAFQRKALLLHQKQTRQRKEKIIEIIRKSCLDQIESLRGNELETLLTTIESQKLRDETNLLLLDENAKLKELDLLLSKTTLDSRRKSVQSEFKNIINKLADDRQKLATEIKMLRGDTNEELKIRRELSTLERGQQKVEIETGGNWSPTSIEYYKNEEKKVTKLEKDAESLLSELKMFEPKIKESNLHKNTVSI